MDKVSPLRRIDINEENGNLSDFALFWNCYPRKRARLDALKAWRQTESVRPPIEQILAAINRMLAEARDIQYVPYPATYLRRGQWDDE